MSTKQSNGATTAHHTPDTKFAAAHTTTKAASKKSKETDSRLEEFCHDELKDIYWAENHLV